MEKSPYDVLGVSQSASAAQIKAAYRELVKKYHPDQYQGTPMEAIAEEKLKEINLAYDALKDGPRLHAVPNGGAPNGGARGATGGVGGAAYGGNYHTENERYAMIYELIHSGRLGEAEALLTRLPLRDAEWFYLRGVLYARRGWNAEAADCYVQALRLDPENLRYRRAVEGMRTVNKRYTSQRYRNANDTATLGLCLGPCCAPCFCDLCCADCFSLCR